MPKFKPPKDEKITHCPHAGGQSDPSPYMNMDDPHRKWFHPNTMGKMRKQLDLDRREEKKPAKRFKR